MGDQNVITLRFFVRDRLLDTTPCAAFCLFGPGWTGELHARIPLSYSCNIRAFVLAIRSLPFSFVPSEKGR